MIAVLFLIPLEGCSSNPKSNFSDYLNNTLEYFISDTGVEVELLEEGNYTNEEKGIQVAIKDNIMNYISMTKKVRGYGIENIQIGDKKKSVNKSIPQAYKATGEPSQDEENQTITYQYENGNRLLSVTYDADGRVNKVAVEITKYVVGDHTQSNGGESQISKDDIMVSVGNIDVTYSEAMIYLRTAQQIYETEFGNEVFGYDLQGNGTTIGSVLKQEVLEQIIQLEIINVVANEKGITLNDDEMLEVRNFADEFMQTISQNDREKYGITEELAVRVFATNVTAQKLYETVTIDVDTDVTDEEAQQAKIYKLFIKKYGTDSKGNRTELQKSELKEIKSKVKALHEEALKTTDFYSFADSNSDEDTIEYVVGRNDLNENESNIVFQMKDGQVSDIIEDEDGYTIIYCADAYDEDATLQVKEEIIEKRRSELFVKLYSEWYSKYEVRVNMNLWNKLELSPLETVE